MTMQLSGKLLGLVAVEIIEQILVEAVETGCLVTEVDYPDFDYAPSLYTQKG